jgi:hypothetical protein
LNADEPAAGAVLLERLVIADRAIEMFAGHVVSYSDVKAKQFSANFRRIITRRALLNPVRNPLTGRAASSKIN